MISWCCQMAKWIQRTAVYHITVLIQHPVVWQVQCKTKKLSSIRVRANCLNAFVWKGKQMSNNTAWANYKACPIKSCWMYTHAIMPIKMETGTHQKQSWMKMNQDKTVSFRDKAICSMYLLWISWVKLWIALALQPHEYLRWLLVCNSYLTSSAGWRRGWEEQSKRTP